MTLFGWTLKQWGLALALIDRKPQTLGDYARARRDYLVKYGSDPVETLTVYSPNGDDRPCNYDSAANGFSLAPSGALP